VAVGDIGDTIDTWVEFAGTIFSPTGNATVFIINANNNSIDIIPIFLYIFFTPNLYNFLKEIDWMIYIDT
jgi:hypothetical protein